MSETVERLKSLLEKATKGPWLRSKHGFQIIGDDENESVTETKMPGSYERRFGDKAIERYLTNLDLACAAVNALPGLIACAEAAQQYLKECDSPVTDPLLRRSYRDALRAALATLTKETR